jgi:hypothetical protein
MDEQKQPPPGWRVVEGSDGDVWEHELCGDLVGVSRDPSGGAVTLVNAWTVEDPASYMLTEVARVERDMTWRAKQIDATDEQRLAAGWEQQALGCRSMHDYGALEIGDNRRQDAAADGYTLAPGPAGRWRLHPSGCWVRWVVPVGGAS